MQRGYRKMTVMEMWASVFLTMLTLVVAFFVIRLWVGGIDQAQLGLRTRHHRGPEVVDKTIKTAFTSHELLIMFRKDLREFDQLATEAFGVEHRWPATSSAEHPPKHIREWLKTYPPTEQEAWLLKYSQVVDARNGYRLHWHSISEDVQDSVANLPAEATTDHVMRAENKLLILLPEAMEDFTNHRKILETLIVQYKERKKP